MPQKRQTHFIRACRLIFINITLSNRIVKPNNRYTRQPVSHDFLFYSAPDKVYVLTVTNHIAMRFAVRSAPPFRYRTKRTDYSTGGTWSGTLPQAEFETAHSRSLSRCRLPQRKYQRIASPMRKHRHNAPLYCPYIRLQESYLPSFRRLYRRQ